VDLVLSPQHERPSDRAAQVVALKHVTFPAPPAAIRLRCDLFGVGAEERAFTIKATLHPEPGRAEEETSTITREGPEHVFFGEAQGGRGPGGLRSGGIAVVVAGVGGWVVWMVFRRRKHP
jgi:hypothetical protein